MSNNNEITKRAIALGLTPEEVSTSRMSDLERLLAARTSRSDPAAAPAPAHVAPVVARSDAPAQQKRSVMSVMHIPTILKSEHGLRTLYEDAADIGDRVRKLEQDRERRLEIIQTQTHILDVEDIRFIYDDVARIDAEFDEIANWLDAAAAAVREMLTLRRNLVELIDGPDTDLGRKFHVKNNKLDIVLSVFAVELSKIKSRKRMQ
jgi:hypothetical protein